MIYAEEYISVFQTQVLVGKPFQYQTPVISPIHPQDHWNKPHHPPSILSVKYRKMFCSSMSSVDPPQNQSCPNSLPKLQYNVERRQKPSSHIGVFI
jgi:hypothetical protein